MIQGEGKNLVGREPGAVLVNNPKTIRIAVPSPSAERRNQLAAQAKKMGEESKVAVRNERRAAKKQIDSLVKD